MGLLTLVPGDPSHAYQSMDGADLRWCNMWGAGAAEAILAPVVVHVLSM